MKTEQVKLTGKKIGINGEGIAYLDKKPVFIEGLLPEETAVVQLSEDQPRYARGKVIRRINDSPVRVEAACPLQQRCSGCPLMVMDREEQLKVKQELVREALIKYAGIPARKVSPVMASPQSLGYRNQCKLPIRMEKGKLVNGLYEEGSNRMIPIRECLIHDPKLEKMRKKIMKLLNEAQCQVYQNRTKKGLRTLVLRGFDGHYQCTLVTGEDQLPESLVSKLSQLEGMDCLMQNIHPDHKSIQLFSDRWVTLHGQDKLPVQIGDLTLNLSCASFFQLNLPQAIQMYQKAAELLEPCDMLVEAYSGVGGISLMLKDKAKKIIGIEYVPQAVENANENAKLNHADHVRFICGDAAREMKKLIRRQKIDAVVVDPPRSGLDEKMIKSLRECQPHQIIYISCNPATLAKNLKELKDLYQIRVIQPYDMFPNTAHVETIVSLVSKEK